MASPSRPVAKSHSENVHKYADALFHDSKNLAVNNLPEWLRSEDEMAKWEFFGQYGQIEDIVVPNKGAAAAAATKSETEGETGRLQHWAIIRYETADAARTAMRCVNGANVTTKHPKAVREQLRVHASEQQAKAATEGGGDAPAVQPKIDVCPLSVSLHPTRYCSYFLSGEPCPADHSSVDLMKEVSPSQDKESAAQQQQAPKVIALTGAAGLPMESYNASISYIETILKAELESSKEKDAADAEPSTPTSSAAGTVMDLINPNRQQKLSAGARPFIPGVGGVPIVPGSEHRETRISTWQGVLTEEMALMAQIQSLRKDHTDPEWEKKMFAPAVFPFTQGLALPSPAQKDSTDEKLMTEHRLHKVVDITGPGAGM